MANNPKLSIAIRFDNEIIETNALDKISSR